MSVTIKAKFENEDSAEFAAGRLRSDLDGIRSIKIASKNTGSEKENFVLLPTALVSQNYYTDIVYLHPRQTEPNQRRRVILSVECEDIDTAARCRRILISMGGSFANQGLTEYF